MTDPEGRKLYRIRAAERVYYEKKIRLTADELEQIQEILDQDIFVTPDDLFIDTIADAIDGEMKVRDVEVEEIPEAGEKA